jgi:hypothetical protein
MRVMLNEGTSSRKMARIVYYYFVAMATLSCAILFISSAYQETEVSLTSILTLVFFQLAYIFDKFSSANHKTRHMISRYFGTSLTYSYVVVISLYFFWQLLANEFDITPFNTSLFLFHLGILSLLMFVWQIGSITSILKKNDKDQKKLDSHIDYRRNTARSSYRSRSSRFDLDNTDAVGASDVSEVPYIIDIPDISD